MLLTSAFSIKLILSNNPTIDDLNTFFTLASEQAQGSVSFSCQGLPQGIVLSGKLIQYNGNVALQGQFPVKITATDAQGATDTQIILLNVNLSGKGSVTYPSSSSYQNVNQVLSSISTVSDASSSSASSSSSSSSSSGSSAASSGGAQVLSVNGVNYNFGNSLGINLNANTGGISIGTISNPSSSSSSSSSSSTVSGNSDVNAVNNLVTQYSQNYTLISTSSKNISSYPTSVIVTGKLPNQVPNTAILNIATAQAQKSNQAINALSEYDLNITNLFNQQTEVSQTIANLLEIIRQGSANRQKAQTDINSFTTSLNSAVTNQQQLAISITQQENKVKNMQSAITGAAGQLDSLNGQLTKLNSQISSAKSTGLGLTQQLSVALNNKDGLKNQITLVNGTIQTINSNLNSQSQSCSQANQVIIVLKGNITVLQNSIAGIDQKVATIDGNIKDYNAQIAALQAQINALNGKISQANSDRQTLVSLNYTVPQQIANINAQISAQQATCQNAYSPNDLKNAQDQLSALIIQLNTASNAAESINANITLVKGQLTELLSQNSQLTLQINKTQADLTTLKQQLPQEQGFLSTLYVQGNQALQTVQTLNATLQAAIIRFNRENNALTVANVNLQTARSQQQKISQKINLILQENTAGLPFPSAPITCGLTNSLSAINSIDSISNYLLTAYGAELNFNTLAGFSNLNKLYSFSNAASNMKSNCPELVLSSSSSSSQSQSSTSSSSSSSGLYSGLGTITKVSSGSNV